MNMRIGGLASGMDIDQLVSDLIRAERTKVDKVYQERTLASWQQEAYQEVNRVFANFILDSKKELGLTRTTSSGTLLSSGVSSLDWVKAATLSNAGIASVQASAEAVAGSYQLQVHQLASNWSAASGSAISTGAKDNLATQFGLNAETDILNFTITTNLGELTIYKEKEDLSNVTINDLVKEINAANIGVTAMYDAQLDRFFLQTKNTGSNNTLQITDESVLTDGRKFLTGSENILNLQYLDDAGVSHDVADAAVYSGKDALLDFGAAKGITQSSNNFMLNNVNITLKATGAATLEVATNVEGIIAKVSDFVEKYNAFIDKINGELGEERYKDYRPLTDEQRDQLSEKQEEQWEEKAKSGLLRNDEILVRTLNTVRVGLYEEVSGVVGSFAHLTELGITTESYARGSRGGKLQINTAKLTEAINKDPEGVLELLFKKPDDSLALKNESSLTPEQIREKRSQSGIITRLYDNLIAGMKDVIHKAGPGSDGDLHRNVSSNILLDFVVEHGSISKIDKWIDDFTDKIKRLEDILLQREDRYWRQFTAMEKAIQMMNEQSLWLSQQFGGGGF